MSNASEINNRDITSLHRGRLTAVVNNDDDTQSHRSDKEFEPAAPIATSAQDARKTEGPEAWILCEDLTACLGSQASINCPFGADAVYEAFFEACFRALHRVSPRHVLLVRERGVGERSVLVELARRGIAGHPPYLRSKRVVLADARRLTRDQIGPSVDYMRKATAARHELILCVDGIGQLIRGDSPCDTRSTTLAWLAQTRCRVIGILSPREYEEHVSSDAECQELFSIVHLHEPETPTAIKLVRHFADGLQTQYRLRIEDAAVRRAVALSSSYVPHERLPLKAVKVLQAICDDVLYERSQFDSNRNCVEEPDVVTKVARISGIPASTLAGVGDRVDYIQSLRDSVVGQENAVREVAAELGLIKAGMTDSGKPASVLLFVGQTGTGKTELAKAVARFYSSSGRLKTFTLGNFSEPHSVSGIIGVPAGYVGHDQGGRLVNELNADPYSVFLLDEADKAHPDVMQPFLNLFDEGWIYDQRGVKAYADRALFILTTNVAQRQIGEMCKQGKSDEEITAAIKDSLARIRHTKSNRPVFTPEFLARVKRVIIFRSLDADAMLRICQNLVAEMVDRWRAKRQKTLVVSSNLIGIIASKAYSADEKSGGKEGGRIVRKLLADLVESRIQATISEDPGSYHAATIVTVDMRLPGEELDAPVLNVATSRALAEMVVVRFSDEASEAGGAEGHDDRLHIS